ncbi:MAG: hypothetical protein C0602_03570 [Denitrovibrio sp.]|nr:MAG: hypothetical protein C0602_03570 [Denitrovibrio sp.]
MSVKNNIMYEEIYERLNDISSIIRDIIDCRTATFPEMLETHESINESSDELLRENSVITDAISKDINEKIENLSMEKMKDEIAEATRTFIEITEELELLSYNTICRTMALGEKGASITHISKEIKKYSTTVKDLLEVISKNFSEMFSKFKHVADNLTDNQLISDKGNLKIENIQELTVSSDVSALEESLQVYETFVSDIENINNAVSVTDFSNPYEAGQVFGIYEKSMSKMDQVKYSLMDHLESMKSVVNDFLKAFSSDLQHTASATNALHKGIASASDASQNLKSNITALKGSVEETRDVLHSTRGSIDFLSKQSKTFRNLVVITAVEVARINDDSLRSVVASMTETEKELNGLIEKLYSNVSIWESLRDEFMNVFTSAEKELEKLNNISINKVGKKILEDIKSLDSQLANLCETFSTDKYIGLLDCKTSELIEFLEQFNESIQHVFVQFNDKLDDVILSSEEFTQGRNDAELKELSKSA